MLVEGSDHRLLSNAEFVDAKNVARHLRENCPASRVGSAS
jgi:hypothetical protein